jgi:hypothetical protein
MTVRRVAVLPATSDVQMTTEDGTYYMAGRSRPKIAGAFPLPRRSASHCAIRDGTPVRRRASGYHLVWP